MSLPVCTLSPICNSDIVTDLPFWRWRLAVEGKQGIFIFILGHLKGFKVEFGKRRKGYPRHCCCCCCLLLLWWWWWSLWLVLVLVALLCLVSLYSSAHCDC